MVGGGVNPGCFFSLDMSHLFTYAIRGRGQEGGLGYFGTGLKIPTQD